MFYICSPVWQKRGDLEGWVSGWNHRFAKPTYGLYRTTSSNLVPSAKYSPADICRAFSCVEWLVLRTKEAKWCECAWNCRSDARLIFVQPRIIVSCCIIEANWLNLRVKQLVMMSFSAIVVALAVTVLPWKTSAVNEINRYPMRATFDAHEQRVSIHGEWDFRFNDGELRKIC